MGDPHLAVRRSIFRNLSANLASKVIIHLWSHCIYHIQELKCFRLKWSISGLRLFVWINRFVP